MKNEELIKCRDYLKSKTELQVHSVENLRIWYLPELPQKEWFVYFDATDLVLKVVDTVECRNFVPFDIGTYDPMPVTSFQDFKRMLDSTFVQYEQAKREQADRRKRRKEYEMKVAALKYEA